MPRKLEKVMKLRMLASAASLLLAACGQGAAPPSGNAANAQTGSSANVADSGPGGSPAMTEMMEQMQGAPMPHDAAMQRMHERHEGMEDIGKINKALRRELAAPAASLAAIRAAAASLARHSTEAAHWFPAGTGPAIGKTGAKPEIWQKPQDFASKLHNFQVAAGAFDAAAKAGDIAAIKARYSDLGGTCKACHDHYRSEMHH